MRGSRRVGVQRERGRGRGLDAKRFHVPAGEGAFHITAGGVGAERTSPSLGIKVTIMRTAAVTAVAVRYLPPPGASSALIVGAGTQAAMQLEALQLVANIETLAVYDLVAEKAEALVEKALGGGIDARVVKDAEVAADEADVVVTITPARTPILNRLPSGSLVVALGADEPGKRELGPEVLARSKVVVDVLDQAA